MSEEPGVAFTYVDPLGIFTLEPFNIKADLELLHSWVTHPRSVYWGMGDASAAQVREEYEKIAANPHHHAWLGRLAGEHLFLCETYVPAHSELASHYAVAPGDVGMHVLVAPPRTPRHGVTSAVMRTVMEFLFSDPLTERVVVEPDIRNDKIAAKNAEVGFVIEREIQMSDKRAHLSFCFRADYSRCRRTH